jgi:hypothetical protein
MIIMQEPSQKVNQYLRTANFSFLNQELFEIYNLKFLKFTAFYIKKIYYYEKISHND